MMTLDQLFVKYDCDKGTLPGGIGHRYGRHYTEVLEPLRHLPIRLVEIGVENGKSVKVWLDYFTHASAQIVGVDRNPFHLSDSRFQFVLADQTNAASLQPLMQWASDVIIDDGAHTPEGTITAFETLWPFVKRGGYFIIEDLRCSYMPGYQSPGWGTQMSFVKRLLDDINAQTDYKPSPDCVFTYPTGTDGGRGIEWMKFSEELCILKKK